MSDDLFRTNRARLLAELSQRGAAAVIPTARPKVRNHDCDYRFRPTSDFYWATGFREPSACLVLVPGSAATASSHPSS